MAHQMLNPRAVNIYVRVCARHRQIGTACSAVSKTSPRALTCINYACRKRSRGKTTGGGNRHPNFGSEDQKFETSCDVENTAEHCAINQRKAP